MLKSLPRLVRHLGDIHEAQATGDATTHTFAAKVHVLNRGQVRSQCEVLIHGFDTEQAGLAWRTENDRLPLKKDLTAIERKAARESLNEGRLSPPLRGQRRQERPLRRVVFPAPLPRMGPSPHRETPQSQPRLMPRQTRIFGKDLVLLKTGAAPGVFFLSLPSLRSC